MKTSISLRVKSYISFRRDKFYQWLSQRLPLRLIYWCTNSGGGFATSGKYGTTDPHQLTLMELLKRLDEGDR